MEELKTFWVDLHLHSVLSPCAELEMGASEIVQRCRSEGISLIAVTDHNHVANFKAIRDAAEGNPVVLPGLEVQSMEDIHIVVLFKDNGAAVGYKNWLWEKMPTIKNKEEKFGYQLIIDKENNVIDQEEILLIQGIQRSIDEIAAEGKMRGAIVLPAHMDRPSFSYQAVLGPMPDNFPCDGIEISSNVSHKNFAEWRALYPNKTLIRSSDSHKLASISRSRCTPMKIKEPSFDEVKKAIRGEDGREAMSPLIYSY